MKKYKFNIKGMHCASCSKLIESELNDRKGISVSKINHESGKAAVVYNEDDITEAEIKKAVEGAGDYKVESDTENGSEDEEDNENKKINNNKIDNDKIDSFGKKKFFHGLMTGMAIISTIGFFTILTAYLNQNKTTEVVAKNIVEKNVVEKQPSPSPAPTPTPVPPSKVNIKVADSDHVRGNKNALITVVEFSDFQCPYCSRFHDTMNQIIKDYPDDVRWVYKHFPLDSIHPLARKTAEASECAGEQNKFWEYTDEVFANQESITTDSLSVFAKNIGLNVIKFDSCLESGKYKSKVESDYQEGIAYGVKGTPGNFINGQAVSGAVPYSQIESIIKSLK
ncbi:MAG: thioredoxin domain-containing protein [bacterium]